MEIHSFVKRLNATELGIGETNDTFIAIPKEVDLSRMLVNKQPMEIIDKETRIKYAPPDSNIMYVQTGQNGQERISGLGQYLRSKNGKVGDELLIERIDKNNTTQLFLDLCHRNSIVFQKYNKGFEILNPEELLPYQNENGFSVKIIRDNNSCDLDIVFVEESKKKKISPKTTKFYDLLVNGKSILDEYKYQEYAEILKDGMRFDKMRTYINSIVYMED